jgi:uncharacterized membrane protein YqjE
MDKSAEGPGLIGSLAGLARNVFGLVLSRVELASIELSEVRNHLFKLIVVAAVALVAGLFAVAFGSMIIVTLFWADLGWKILLIMMLVFVVLAAALALYARSMLSIDKLSLPATMAELKADRDMLL